MNYGFEVRSFVTGLAVLVSVGAVACGANPQRSDRRTHDELPTGDAHATPIASDAAQVSLEASPTIDASHLKKDEIERTLASTKDVARAPEVTIDAVSMQDAQLLALDPKGALLEAVKAQRQADGGTALTAADCRAGLDQAVRELMAADTFRRGVASGANPFPSAKAFHDRNASLNYQWFAEAVAQTNVALADAHFRQYLAEGTASGLMASLITNANPPQGLRDHGYEAAVIYHSQNADLNVAWTMACLRGP